MTNKLDLYKAYYTAAWANPPDSFDKAAKMYLSEDFKSLDPSGKPEQGRDEWVALSGLLMGAFPDFKYILRGMREEGDGVIVTGHFEGTHAKDLDFSALGLGVIPASGKKIVWPDNDNKFTVMGDKIVSVQPVGESGGTAAFLEPLGLKMPQS
jgi:predicted ester cyclase